jgi:hypothetical protein
VNNGIGIEKLFPNELVLSKPPIPGLFCANTLPINLEAQDLSLQFKPICIVTLDFFPIKKYCFLEKMPIRRVIGGY